MLDEEIFIGYAFMGENSECFMEVYDTEEQAIDAARKAYESNDEELFSGPVSRKVAVVNVTEINKAKLVENAMRTAIDYMNEVYDDFEAGIDDGSILINNDIMDRACPVLYDSIDFGGVTQKGSIMYVYDLVENKITE